VVECLIDEMNRPRLSVDARVRIPPTEAEIEQLFAGWRQELMSCRKFAPAARNYMVALTCQMIEANIGSSCEGQPAGSEVHKCSTAPRRPEHGMINRRTQKRPLTWSYSDQRVLR